MKPCMTKKEHLKRLPMEYLRESLRYIGKHRSPAHLPRVIHRIIWALMRTNTQLNKLGDTMDKKMHKITESMKKAGADIAKAKPKMAAKVLKKAEKANEKLVKIDRDVRDPLIDKCKKEMPKLKARK